MKLRSRGLGRKELVMDFREYEVRREGDEILIVGTIHEPVHWDFTIRVCEDDLAGLFRVARRRSMLAFLLRAMFRREKKAHWSDSRAEHLAGVKQRIAKRVADAAARAEAEAKAQAEAAAKAQAEAEAEVQAQTEADGEDHDVRAGRLEAESVAS